MRPCVLCHKPRPEASYSLRYGKPKKTCDLCCARLKARYHEGQESKTPRVILFQTLIDTYELTEEEAHAVDMAAGQTICYRRFKRKHKGERWAGPTAEEVLEPVGRTVRRRIELAQATTLRAREIILAQGLDVRAFFSSHT